MTTRTCNQCKEEKPISEFNKDKTKKNGYRSKCKLCKNGAEMLRRPTYLRHGMSKESYEELLAACSGRCQICPKRTGLVIDHDHSCCPGKYSCGNCIRGILCGECNSMLGLARDDINTFRAAIEYLS